MSVMELSHARTNGSDAFRVRKQVICLFVRCKHYRLEASSRQKVQGECFG